MWAAPDLKYKTCSSQNARIMCNNILVLSDVGLVLSDRLRGGSGLV